MRKFIFIISLIIAPLLNLYSQIPGCFNFGDPVDYIEEKELFSLCNNNFVYALRENKVKKIDCFTSDSVLRVTYLINRNGRINYEFYTDKNKYYFTRIRYDKFSNPHFTYSNTKSSSECEIYEGTNLMRVYRDNYCYIDPEGENPPVNYNFIYDEKREKIKQLEIRITGNDSLFILYNVNYNSENKLSSIISGNTYKIDFEYRGDSILKITDETFYKIYKIKNNRVISLLTGYRDSAYYGEKWKDFNNDYIYFEEYLYSANGLIEDVYTTYFPSGTKRRLFYYKYYYYDN